MHRFETARPISLETVRAERCSSGATMPGVACRPLSVGKCALCVDHACRLSCFWGEGGGGPRGSLATSPEVPRGSLATSPEVPKTRSLGERPGDSHPQKSPRRQTVVLCCLLWIVSTSIICVLSAVFEAICERTFGLAAFFGPKEGLQGKHRSFLAAATRTMPEIHQNQSDQR